MTIQRFLRCYVRIVRHASRPLFEASLSGRVTTWHGPNLARSACGAGEKVKVVGKSMFVGLSVLF